MAEYVNVGNCCFFGTNCTVKNETQKNNQVLVGAGAYFELMQVIAKYIFFSISRLRKN